MEPPQAALSLGSVQVDSCGQISSITKFSKTVDQWAVGGGSFAQNSGAPGEKGPSARGRGQGLARPRGEEWSTSSCPTGVPGSLLFLNPDGAAGWGSPRPSTPGVVLTAPPPAS